MKSIDENYCRAQFEGQMYEEYEKLCVRTISATQRRIEESEHILTIILSFSSVQMH